MNSKGFTIIEVLIAAAILASSTLIVLSLVQYNTTAAAYDNHRVIGTAIAENVMENLIEEFPNTPDLLPSGNPHGMYFDQNQSYLGALPAVPPAGTIYTATWNVSLDTPSNGVMTIALSVTWVGQGLTNIVNISTFRGEN